MTCLLFPLFFYLELGLSQVALTCWPPLFGKNDNTCLASPHDANQDSNVAFSRSVRGFKLAGGRRSRIQATSWTGEATCGQDMGGKGGLGWEVEKHVAVTVELPYPISIRVCFECKMPQVCTVSWGRQSHSLHTAEHRTGHPIKRRNCAGAPVEKSRIPVERSRRRPDERPCLSWKNTSRPMPRTPRSQCGRPTRGARSSPSMF